MTNFSKEWQSAAVPLPPAAWLGGRLEVPGAAMLAGEWAGGDRYLLWPEAMLRIGARASGDWLAALDRMDTPFERSTAPVGCDGFVLALAYDAGRRIEPIRARRAVRPEIDDLVLVRHRGALLVDRRGRARLVAPIDRWEARRRELDGRVERPARRIRPAAWDLPTLPGLPRGMGSDFDPRRYARAVAAIRAGIARGDYYQVNLTRRFRAGLGRRSPFELFARLRERHPAARGMLLALADGRALVSNSPETLVVADFDRREALSSPIKGTAPRGANAAADRAARKALAASAKNRAENVMIVDLVRNDLGRVAETSTVRVKALFRAVRTPIVHHLVSDVSARLAAGVGPGALVAALFPAGSITGAPKRAAMQAIEGFERARRGYYCGSLGFFDRSRRQLELSVAIRTAWVDGSGAEFWAGGGIVADSDADEEWAEGNYKALEMMEALS